MSEWDIWAEGYRATGEHGTATKLNTEPIEAGSFDEAVRAHVRNLADKKDRAYYRLDEDGQWSMWACRLYPDETTARKAFG